MKYDKALLYLGDKQIGVAHDVVVTFDERGPRVEPGALQFDDPVVEFVTWQTKHLQPFRWLSPFLAETEEQRQRRQTRNKRKAARRKVRR
jgi:hypothetical protein